MKILTKSLLSAGAAAAALVSAAAPAQARDHRGNDGISAGEVIAGAVILGGLAAVIASSDNDRRDNGRYYDDGYDNRYDSRYDRGYGYNNRYGGSRSAVNQCINAVENWGNRYSRTDVTRIHNIDRTRNGYRITGNIVVNDGWRGRGNGNSYARGYDQGRFTCHVERGRVVDVDYRGLDRWR